VVGAGREGRVGVVTDPPGENADRAADDRSGPERSGPGQSGPDDPPRHGSEEEIDEASDESFPASDAPQWWSGEPADPDT